MSTAIINNHLKLKEQILLIAALIPIDFFSDKMQSMLSAMSLTGIFQLKLRCLQEGLVFSIMTLLLTRKTLHSHLRSLNTLCQIIPDGISFLLGTKVIQAPAW